MPTTEQEVLFLQSKPRLLEQHGITKSGKYHDLSELYYIYSKCELASSDRQVQQETGYVNIKFIYR